MGMPSWSFPVLLALVNAVGAHTRHCTKHARRSSIICNFRYRSLKDDRSGERFVGCACMFVCVLARLCVRVAPVITPTIFLGRLLSLYCADLFGLAELFSNSGRACALLLKVLGVWLLPMLQRFAGMQCQKVYPLCRSLCAS